MKIMIKVVVLAACWGFSFAANAFMPLECTPLLQDNSAPENIVVRTDFKQWHKDLPDDKAVIYFIQSNIAPERKWALYRARDIFNKNASAARIQIIETDYWNPVTWGLLSPGTNSIHFRNDSEFPFAFVSASGLALDIPLCVYGTNSISKAVIYLNDTPGYNFIDSNGNIKYLAGAVGTSVQAPTEGLETVQPWIGYPNAIPELFKPPYYYNYRTVPPGAVKDEWKNEHAYYNGNGKDRSLIELALHEIGHPFGLNHEAREINNMGVGNASAHGDYLMDWVGQDMTQFLTKIYPSTTEYRDLSVRNVKQVYYRDGYPIDYNLFDSLIPLVINDTFSPVFQTDYATISRTRAYTNSTSVATLPGSNDGTFTYVFDYMRNPVECMVKGNNYFVEFVYENNGLIDDEGEQPVTFFLSTDATISPNDPTNPFDPTNPVPVNALIDPNIDLPIGPVLSGISTIDVDNNKINFTRNPDFSVLEPAYQGSNTSWVFDTDYWSQCFEILYCAITVRRSKVLQPTYYTRNALDVTRRSEITIPNSVPAGRYYLGPYIGPMKNLSSSIIEDNLDNNATYMEVRIEEPTTGC
jgi:hypothetical protein